MTTRTLVLLPATVFLFACGREARQEAESVAIAVERFRAATVADKPTAIEPLRAARCSDTLVCRTRDACLAFAEPMARSVLLQREIETQLRALDAGTVARGDPAVETLPDKAVLAGTLLEESEKERPACDEALFAMKRAARR